MDPAKPRKSVITGDLEIRPDLAELSDTPADLEIAQRLLGQFVGDLTVLASGWRSPSKFVWH